MKEEITRADINIGILRALIADSNRTPTTVALAQFILDNISGDETQILGSFLYICQKMFESDPDTLIRMNIVVLSNVLK